MTIEELEKEVELIKQRNTKVETEKAWEVSSIRRLAIALITYLFMLNLFLVIKVEKPFINALVPAIGFLLSNLSLSVIKKYWINKFIK